MDFRNGTVIVEPDEIAERSDGVVAIRRIRTGSRGSSEFDKIEYALFLRAAETHYGPRGVVEVVHLSDNAIEDVPRLTPRKATTRIKKTEAILTNIGSNSNRIPMHSAAHAALIFSSALPHLKARLA